MFAGTLYYIALKKGFPTPQIAKELVLPTYGNFSGSLLIPQANANASVTLCIADGGSFDLYGLVQVGLG